MDGDHIFVKEATYKTQMAQIRESVLRFAESKDWQQMNRGRRAHVSIHGKINVLDGHIDIIMQEDDWSKMPESLQPDTPFNLFCTAGINVEGVDRRFGDTQLFWQCPFSILADTVNRFLPIAWQMLANMTAANLLRDWPGPTENPDGPPWFGSPHKVPKSPRPHS